MAVDKEIAIEVKNVRKDFVLRQNKSSTIKQATINMFRKNSKTVFRALDDVTFNVQKGDFFGIVGRNGSGKSTLLKLIAGVYEPTAGNVYVHGSLTPFIELGVGFNPELSGRDNVFLNGALLGFNHRLMAEMYDEIVKFAELGPFMDQKLKNYSSGMQVRLAFSIAIKAQGDILVLDEVLAVGDEAFQRKCYSYFANLKKEGKTVVLVTHSMDAVQQFCNKAMVIENGNILMTGNPARVAQRYRELFMNEEEKGLKKENDTFVNKNITAHVRYQQDNKKIKFDVTVNPKADLKDSAVVFLINKSSGERVYRWASDSNNIRGLDLSKKFELHLELDDIFPVGSYFAGISIVSKDRVEQFAVFDNLLDFEKFRESDKSQWDVYWKPNEKYSIRNI